MNTIGKVKYRTYLVTGGAGFIGSNFIRKLLSLEESVRVINLDKLTYAGNSETISDIERKYSERHEFVKGDICNQELVDHIFRQESPEVVVNFAAESHIDRSFESPENFLRTNVEGTATLLSSARDHWGPQYSDRKFLQVSTDKVYGSLRRDDLESKFEENDPLSPNSPYAASKASAEHVVQSYIETYGLPALITRSSNVFGPYQYPEKLIPIMVHRAYFDSKLPIYGDGRNMREWLFVDDACDAYISVLKNGEPGEIYNIGSGEEFKNIDVVKSILAYLDKSDELIYHTEDRPVHDDRCALDTTKIEERIGWEPRVDFESALSETVEWYLENFDWVDAVTGESYRKWVESNHEGFSVKGY